MDILRDKDYRDTFDLYFIFATLPGKNPTRRVLVNCAFAGVLILGAFFQLAKLFYVEIDSSLLINLLPHLIPTVFCLLFITVQHLNRHKRGKMLSIMQEDMDESWSEEEDEIKRRYVRMITCVLVVGFLTSSFTPRLIGLFVHSNETRRLKLLFEGHFFVDEEKYFYYIYFFECCVYTIALVLLNSSEGILLIATHHICGMFAVIGHRLENLRGVDRSVSTADSDADCVVRTCVDHHARAVRLVIAVNSIADVPLFILLVGTVFDLTVLLLTISDVQSIDVKTVSFSVGIMIHFFVISHVGQKIIDESLLLSQKTYNARWYEYPARLQRLFITILLKTNKPCELVTRKIYPFSMANFMSVMETTISYFMVLRRCQ